MPCDKLTDEEHVALRAISRARTRSGLYRGTRRGLVATYGPGVVDGLVEVGALAVDDQDHVEVRFSCGCAPTPGAGDPGAPVSTPLSVSGSPYGGSSNLPAAMGGEDTDVLREVVKAGPKTARDLATDFANRALVAAWGHAAGAANEAALRRQFGTWLKEGLDAEDITEMIRVYFQGQEFKHAQGPLWKHFLSRRQGLLSSARINQANRLGEAHRDDEGYWVAAQPNGDLYAQDESYWGGK